MQGGVRVCARMNCSCNHTGYGPSHEFRVSGYCSTTCQDFDELERSLASAESRVAALTEEKKALTVRVKQLELQHDRANGTLRRMDSQRVALAVRVRAYEEIARACIPGEGEAMGFDALLANLDKFRALLSSGSPAPQEPVLGSEEALGEEQTQGDTPCANPGGDL